VNALWPIWDSSVRAWQSAAAELIPRLVVALLVLLAAWVLAVLARWSARRGAGLLALERWLWRAGVLPQVVPGSFSDSRRWLSQGIYFVTLTAGAAAALAILNDQLARGLFQLVVFSLPKAVVLVATLAAAWWLSRHWSRGLLIWLAGEGVAHPWRWAALARLGVMAAGVALASEVSGVATALVRAAFLFLLAGLIALFVYAAAPAVRAQLTLLLGPRPPQDAGASREAPADPELWR